MNATRIDNAFGQKALWISFRTRVCNSFIHFVFQMYFPRVKAKAICLRHFTMLPEAFGMDPIDNMLTRYRTISAYQATVRSFHGSGEAEIIRYYFQQPGMIRMEFIKPHRGAVLIYDPKQKRIFLWPFGSMWLPPLSLSPDNPMVQSPTGQRVDRSDIGSLLENIRALQDGGETRILDEESTDEFDAVHIVVRGKPHASLGDVHCYEVWLDQRNAFPVRVSSFDAADCLMETVVLEDVEIDPCFPARFFAP